MSFLKHRIPPPLVALLCAGAMAALASAVPPASAPGPVRLAAAALAATAGVLVMLAGVVSFARARTTVNPLNPGAASALVTGGIFRYTRNPMYLGMLLVLAGWAVYLLSPAAPFGVVAFWAYINRFQITPEERALQALFGQAFADYTRRVRRWL